MKKLLIYIIFSVIIGIYCFADFINTPSMDVYNNFSISSQDYKSSGKSYSLKTSSLYFNAVEKKKFSFGVKYTDISSNESNTKYISDSLQYDLIFHNGKNRFCITYKDFTKSGFYDALIFHFGMAGFGMNFNGSDNVDSIAGFGGYDYTNLIKKQSLSKPLYSSDFVEDFFFVFNREFRIRKDVSIKYDYNGDYSTYSLNYKKDNFVIEFGIRDNGDYDKLSELAGIDLSTSFFKVLYKFN